MDDVSVIDNMYTIHIGILYFKYLRFQISLSQLFSWPFFSTFGIRAMSWRSSTLAANLTGNISTWNISLEISVIQSPCHEIHSLNYITCTNISIVDFRSTLLEHRKNSRDIHTLIVSHCLGKKSAQIAKVCPAFLAPLDQLSLPIKVIKIHVCSMTGFNKSQQNTYVQHCSI